ncbi:hypothetical protein [Opitutus terrae]|uniref:Uncharacterized protein n=1 Tax=Opitutus terrae (strain DSM 11246 / JCM 15787 / PB90-1) TaxID=452637 RepID=B1ZVI0_OPITP|nr:hypothetical protein [Opitutus terrae]ACB74077.1 conserved hypothetical protein [Opitutus terrae PB90-1]
MILRTRPVRFLITRIARAYGFLDPVALLASLRGFAKPSEVAEPIELLRAGMLFHARGLVNTKAIQNNLDWVWPYWVERQFNPADPSFIPRAFSFSHINLTHRNWTAVGRPDVPFYPIVDPRGLVTPLFDGWSLDFWFVPEEGPLLLPSKLSRVEQTLSLEQNLQVRTIVGDAAFDPADPATDGVGLESCVTLELERGQPHCTIHVRTLSRRPGAIAVALRPYNPEGVSFIKDIAVAPDWPGWLINHRHEVRFDRAPERHLLSTYAAGDVLLRLRESFTAQRVTCPVSMATAVALFSTGADGHGSSRIRVPIFDELEPRQRPVIRNSQSWSEAVAPLARLTINEPRLQRLYDLAVANVVLHAPGEVYPGPYTYKRFWFRDAVFVLNALLSLGAVERTRRALREFAPRQRLDGYFLSQEGEWDSNGEALWFYHRFAALTGESLPADWLHAVAKGARWIHRKRLPLTPPRLEAGLLPAGFSAEHLGPNDYYYWDDFWAVGGLRAAAELLRATDPADATECAREADEFLETIRRSFPAGPHRRFPGAIPASPHRRMDSGSVGSLVADYPLQLFAPGDRSIAKTADYLCNECLHDGGFFQNMIHSGINAYLTLHLAQVRLRAGKPQAAWALIDRVAELASPTGQWPEAIHPLTLGGCMGDGQHIWAAAEWLMMIRHLFVREEAGTLVIGAGLRPEWWRDAEAAFGPTLTPYGAVRVRISAQDAGARVQLDAAWRGGAPALEFHLPGCAPLSLPPGEQRNEFILTRNGGQP